MPRVYNRTLEAWKILPLDAIACMMLPGDKIGYLSGQLHKDKLELALAS